MSAEAKRDTKHPSRLSRFSESVRLFASIIASVVLIALYAVLYLTISPPQLAFAAPWIAGLTVFAIIDTLVSVFHKNPKMGLVVTAALGLSMLLLIPFYLDGVVSLVIAGTPIGWIVFGGIAGSALLAAIHLLYRFSTAQNDAKFSFPSLEELRRQDQDLRKQVNQYFYDHYPMPAASLSSAKEAKEGTVDQQTPELKAAWVYAKKFFKKFPNATKLSRKDVFRVKQNKVAQGVPGAADLPDFSYSFSRTQEDDGTWVIYRVGREKEGAGATSQYKACFTEKEDKDGIQESAHVRGVMERQSDDCLLLEGANYRALKGKMSQFEKFSMSSRYSDSQKKREGVALGRRIPKHEKILKRARGRNLRHVINKERKFSNLRLSSIMRGIAAEVQTFHQANMLHRDIKPENIMVKLGAGEDVEGVKFVDLGMAAKTGEQLLQVQEHASIGTRFFMAPELLKPCQSYTYNEKTEVFALGMTFAILIDLELMLKRAAWLELLDGVNPEAFPKKAAWSKMSDPGTNLEAFSNAQEDALRALCNSMTDDDPSVRPTVFEVIRCLQTLQQQSSPVSPVDGDQLASTALSR